MIELIKLFISFLKVGAFSFGGGFAMIPFIQEQVIYINGWVTESEFLDMIAISQVTPGPISINAATFIGAKVAGAVGGLVATSAVVLPSFVVVMSMLMVLKKVGKTQMMDNIYSGLRPVVMALILSALVSVGETSIIDYKTALIGIGVFLTLMKTRANILFVMAVAGVIGFLVY